MAQIREIKQKINLTKDISQVTKALELVSVVKMKRAQRIALNSRPFAIKVLEILKRLAKIKEDFEELSPFFKKQKASKILAVVVSSDKGFCSAFNKNILNFSLREIKRLQEEGKVEIMAIGKKAIKFFKSKGFKVFVEFTGIGDYGEFEEVKPIADLFVRYFQEGRFQKIVLFYTDFLSTFIQKPKMIQVLPVEEKTIVEFLREKAGSVVEERNYDYIFEPSPEIVLTGLVPQLVEFVIYQTILEANASEHSARMMAMRNASENANEIIEDLRRIFNKARQAQITSEVSEISSAKEAME